MNQIHQQIVNCTALMAGLAVLPDSEYNHSRYTCGTRHCAGGWAAAWGIGGLTASGAPGVPISGISCGSAALDDVFGPFAFKRIFSCPLENDRKRWTKSHALDALYLHIQALAKQAATQP